jgi:nitrogenase molybdenum-cofactor synthesis protein NifE
MKQKEIAALLDEPACEYRRQSKSGRAKLKFGLKPGATAGGCSFDGAPTWRAGLTVPSRELAHG